MLEFRRMFPFHPLNTRINATASVFREYESHLLLRDVAYDVTFWLQEMQTVVAQNVTEPLFQPSPKSPIS